MTAPAPGRRGWVQCTNDYDWNVYWASVPGLTTWTILQKMTLITSACGASRSLSIKWP